MYLIKNLFPFLRHQQQKEKNVNFYLCPSDFYGVEYNVCCWFYGRRFWLYCRVINYYEPQIFQKKLLAFRCGAWKFQQIFVNDRGKTSANYFLSSESWFCEQFCCLFKDIGSFSPEIPPSQVSNEKQIKSFPENVEKHEVRLQIFSLFILITMKYRIHKSEINYESFVLSKSRND